MARTRKMVQPAKVKTCGGKNCYNDQREAELVAREQEMRDLKQELKIDTYHCIYCGKWHLTSRKN